jgi:hypothetical protein
MTTILYNVSNVMILTLQSPAFLFHSDILLSYAYDVFISSDFDINIACFVYENFSKRGKLLIKMLKLWGLHHIANSTVVIMTLVAITNYH